MLGRRSQGSAPARLIIAVDVSAPLAPMSDPQIFQDVANDLTRLDDWEDRYRHLIELGQGLPRLTHSEKSPENKVHGCVSQVWLAAEARHDNGQTILILRGESDAMIVQGLLAILLALYSGRTAQEIGEVDALGKLDALRLREHLTAQRSNGLASMVSRIQSLGKAFSR